MVLDNATAHRVNQELTSDNGRITVVFLPSSCTALIQPIYQNVIQNVKITYRKRLLQEVLLQEDDDIIKCLKNNSLKDAVFSLAECWTQLLEKLIKKSWFLSTTDTDFNEWEEEALMALANLREAGRELVELVNRVNRANDLIEEAEVEKWARDDEEEN